MLMVAIVFVLCVILLFITHGAGHQLYRTNLIRRCEKEWNRRGEEDTREIRIRQIGLNEDQSLDDKDEKTGQSRGIASV